MQDRVILTKEGSRPHANTRSGEPRLAPPRAPLRGGGSLASARNDTGPRRRKQLGDFGHAILLLLACLAAVFPFYWMIKSSLTTQSAFEWPPELIPTSMSLESYGRVVASYPVARWFLNSTFVALTTTLFAVLIALNAALGLSRYRTRLTGAFGAVILITQMLPATLLVIPMFIIFRNLQLIDSLLGLVVANLAFALPLAIWVLKGFFDSIPREIEEASMIDGSSEVGAFYRVTIPLALPGIIAVSIYAFMVSWGEFFFARTLINQEANWVFTVGLSSFRGEHTLQWSELLAAATIFTIPPLLFFAGLQRHLISGLTGGAVKG